MNRWEIKYINLSDEQIRQVMAMYDLEDIFKVIDKYRFKFNSETGEVVNLEEVLEELRK